MGKELKESPADLYFFSLGRVIEAIYYDEDLSDLLYFIVYLASELSGGLGSTLRVLGKDFRAKLLASHGLSGEYLRCGALDGGRSQTEISEGGVVIVKDTQRDSRVYNKEAALKEGIKSIIGIPATVDENTYCVLRIYFENTKIPNQDEMDFLVALLRLACIAIHRSASLNMEA